MPNRIRASPHAAASFPQFSKLIDEIRLMIWECTWPPPRLIEASSYDNPHWEEGNPEQPVEMINLRAAGRMSSMIREDIGSRVTEDRREESCPDPVALQVCHQSRRHTLNHYRIMPSHVVSPFYYHPRRDVLWFSIDVADDYHDHMPFLLRYQGTELNAFETLLVLDCEWPEPPSATGVRSRLTGNTLECISHLGSLKTIRVLWRGSMYSSEASVQSDEDEEPPQVLANRLRRDFPAVMEYVTRDANLLCTANNIELMDIDGNVY